MTKFDVAAYLSRLGLDAPIEMNEAGLEALHRAQAYGIPFENFDILLGREVDLRPEPLFDKLVVKRRGGYCFELNGLFLQALQAFGFDSQRLLARVHLMGEPTPRTHEAILVRVGGSEWIADVGFGANGLRAPIPFVLDEPIEQDGIIFRLVDAPPFGTMLQARESDEWQNIYSFDLEHVCDGDVEMGNYFTSTHPSSFFTWARVATLPNPRGRVSLMDFTLREIADGQETVTTLEAGAPYLEALQTHFGIALDAPYEALREPREGPAPF